MPALVASGSIIDSQSNHSFQQAFGLSHYGYLSKEGTPLHWAVARNSARAVTALLKAGADPYMRNASGLSPAHVASFNHQSDLLEIMLKYSKHVWSPPDKFKDSLMVQALKQYRDNQRSGADTLMTAVVFGRSDRELAALAHWAASK